jgi:hypothetical protein
MGDMRAARVTSLLLLLLLLLLRFSLFDPKTVKVDGLCRCCRIGARCLATSI